MALTANKVLVSDNNGDIATSSTDSNKLTYIGSLTSNAEQTGNKVTSLSSANTDTQYPSAKAVYDEIVPNVSASYTAVSNKGGTLPATQNLANLATAIGSIPSGYSEIPSYTVSNSGIASKRSLTLTGNEFSNITTIRNMAYSFYSCNLLGNLNLSSVTTVEDDGLMYGFHGTRITSLNMSSLTTVGAWGMEYAFENCGSLTSIDFTSLQTIGAYGFNAIFSNDTDIKTASFPSLQNIDNNGMQHAFFYVEDLETVYFTSLTSIDFQGLYEAFMDCEKLTDIYFNALTTSSSITFAGMMTGTGSSTTHTLHVPSNLQTKISGLSCYPNFGGTSGYVTLAFDLPSTS